MIIFLYGQDSYRIDQKLKELIEGYKAKNPSAFNFVSLDFTENDFEDLVFNLKSESLIPEKKLVVCKNIFRIDGSRAIDLLASYGVSKNQDVIFIAVSLEKSDSKSEPRNVHQDALRGELFQYLIKKPNLSSEFQPLAGSRLRSWLINFAKSCGIAFDGEALDYLIDNVGGDLWRQEQEIKKLADYKIKGVIRLIDAQNLVSQKSGINIFDLTDAIGARNRKKVLLLWHKALEIGEEPIELLGLFAWHIRNLLKVKNSGANLKDLGLHPYVLEKTARQARFFKTDDLKLMLKAIGELDLALKVSSANPKTAFLDFVNILG